MAIVSNNIDVSAVIYALLNTKWSKLQPRQINNGNCDSFAFEIYEQMNCKGEQIFLDDIGIDVPHSVYVLDGFYYDAENPEGVKNPLELNMVKNYLKAGK